MKNGKKTFKIIIIIAVILVCSIAGVAYTYFFTDVFKTEKQKFFKYMSQNIENISSLKSEELTKYYEKKKTQSYENSGEFYTDVEEKTASRYMPNRKVYNEVKNFKIVFDGQKDPENNYEHDTISLKYSNNEKMTFEFLKEDDYYGIKVDSILKKYLGLENNNLKEFAKNMGVQDTSNIPDKIEIKNYDKYKFTDEDLKAIKEKLYKILDENLQDTMFREEKTDTYTKYSLTLTNGQIKNILSKMYQAIVNDETIIGKFKDFAIHELEMTEQEANEKIEEIKKKADSYIENDNSNQKDEEEKGKDTDLVSISVYENKGKVTSTEIIAENNKITLNIDEGKLTFKVDEGTEDGNSIVYNPYFSISIEKDTQSDSVVYNLAASMNTFASITEWNGEIKYTGMQNLDSVNESLSIQTKSNDEDIISEVKYIYKNDVKFNSNITKEDLKTNSIKVNNYNAEKIQSTLERLTSSIDSLNKKQMQSLGLEADQNPVFYMTPKISDLREFVSMFFLVNGSTPGIQLNENN